MLAALSIVNPLRDFVAARRTLFGGGDFDENYLNLIVAQSGITDTLLDGSLVAATNFVAIGRSGYCGAQIAVTTSGVHTVTSSQPVEVQIYGRVTNKLDAASNLIFTYRYDPDNRLTNRWSAAMGNTAYSYDAVGNLTHVSYVTSPAISLSYDALNRLTTMVDAVGTTAYTYDQVGQLLSAGGLWPDDTVNYSYDNHLRTGMSVQAPNASAWVQSYAYDSMRRLTNITSPAGIMSLRWPVHWCNN
jgi:YD repeat-containing protein